MWFRYPRQVKGELERLKAEKDKLDVIIKEAKISVNDYEKSLNKCKRHIELKKDEIKRWKTQQWTMQNHKSESPKADSASNVCGS